jgi:16S rRNA (uracil1498-N3)-methyltransferase
MTGLFAGERALGPREARYLGTVHRLQPGDAFTAFDPERGMESDAVVVEVAPKRFVVRLGPPRAAKLVAKREVTWLQALPKGEKMDDIVRDATELGATRVVPATTTFTVVKLDAQRQEARRQRWERVAVEAARQCGRGDAPVIFPVMPWPEALAVAKLPAGATFCLYERATVPLGVALEAAISGDDPVAFAAGSEGGFTPGEVSMAEERGFATVSLGAYILRAETVAAATLGALRVLEGARRAR